MKKTDNVLFGVKGVESLFPDELKQGVATISKIVFNESENILYNMRLLRDGMREHRMYDGTYVRLHINGELMMSDTAMERITNIDFIENAKGRVLVAGLGVGLILQAVLNKPDVTEVVVVEKYQDVIDLVAPRFEHPKLKVVCADIFEYELSKEVKFDTIYFDIWAEISTENLDEMRKLHSRFRKNKRTKDSFMDSWYKSRLVVRRAKERRESNRWF